MTKRYDLEDRYHGYLCYTSLAENKDGDWVKWEDYNALQKRGNELHILIRELYDLFQPNKKEFVYTSEDMMMVCKKEFDQIGKLHKEIKDLEFYNDELSRANYDKDYEIRGLKQKISDLED